ncbi:MAG: methyltransferase domain-containing protein [bacterium]|nr:methyltransferase domain-containing protein [bacterium]
MPRALSSAGPECDVFRIESPVSESENLVAELHSLGTSGIEERIVSGDLERVVLLAYFSADLEVEEALRTLADSQVQIAISGPERVPETDWEVEWRRGLAPRRVAGLWIRPSWCDSPGTPEIVIDPQQAFGSGEHASTRLALELVLEELRSGDELLDVGSGSGILSLAALRLGAQRATGIDFDPAACRNAAENRMRNRLPCEFVCGTLAAIDADARFDLVVCNMLLGRMEPWFERICAHATRSLVLSGYLESECKPLDEFCERAGWRTRRELKETQSGDTWCARSLTHARAR